MKAITRILMPPRPPSPEGWLHTGDMAVWDRENFIQIVDRRITSSSSGGENISYGEVICCICKHPSVLECSV